MTTDKGIDLPAPSEDLEQQWVFQWAAYMTGVLPGIELLYAVPNGGWRSPATAARLKATGTKRGVPDMCLPVARGPYHGLYIELKKVRGGRVSVDQQKWLVELRRQGYQALVCHGHDEAVKAIQDYYKEDQT